ncbi:MAG: hypothetical protein ACRBB5_00280 [Nitrosopumilus sp.]
MKLSKEGFERTAEESALSLFYQGIRADTTQEKYTRTLKMILCEYLKDLLEGNFEESKSDCASWKRSSKICSRSYFVYLKRP